MANFSAHLLYGISASTVGAGIGYIQFGLTPAQSIASAVLGSITSLGPDIDHSEGLPGKLLFEALGFLFPVAAISYIPDQYKASFALEHWILYFCLSIFLVRIVFHYTFEKLTVHRGIFHSVPAAFICGEVIFLLFHHVAIKQRLTIACIAMLGYLVHLIADELSSVDWKGNKIKNSWGTALDFGNFRKASSWLAYIVICILAGFIFQTL